MSDDSVKEWAESNFKAMKNKMEELQEELRGSKPRENINVRRVDSENLQGRPEDQIVVEYSVERWYSINYFKKMIENDSSESSENFDDEDRIF